MSLWRWTQTKDEKNNNGATQKNSRRRTVHTQTSSVESSQSALSERRER